MIQQVASSSTGLATQSLVLPETSPAIMGYSCYMSTEERRVSVP